MKKILLCAALFSFVGCSNPKVGYINIQEVFNGFTYKKELEKELIQVKNSRKYILDSLETTLKVMVKKIESDRKNQILIAEYQVAREIYMDKRERFEDDEETIVKQFDEKIIVQLNSYVKEFGKNQKFDIIYGANQTGNIMYADTGYNLTPQVIEFINAKFTGKK